MKFFLQSLIIFGLVACHVSLECRSCHYTKVLSKEEPKNKFLIEMKNNFYNPGYGCIVGEGAGVTTETCSPQYTACSTIWRKFIVHGPDDETETMEVGTISRSCEYIDADTAEWKADGCRRLIGGPLETVVDYYPMRYTREDACFCSTNLCNTGHWKKMCPPRGYCPKLE